MISKDAFRVINIIVMDRYVHTFKRTIAKTWAMLEKAKRRFGNKRHIDTVPSVVFTTLDDEDTHNFHDICKPVMTIGHSYCLQIIVAIDNSYPGEIMEKGLTVLIREYIAIAKAFSPGLCPRADVQFLWTVGFSHDYTS